MKSFFKIFAIGALAIGAASCDESGVENIFLDGGSTEMVIESISPDYGYIGDEFTIYGKNFCAAEEFLNAYIGESPLLILSASKNSITVKVPYGTTTGLVSVKMLEESASSDLLYRVLDMPSIEEVSTLWGFKGDKVTFKGSLLGTCENDIHVTFGQSKVLATISDWSENGFTATIPQDATSGKVEVTIVTQRVNVPFDEFTIRAHGTAYEIKPSEVYIGNEFTIVGTNLGEYTDRCKVKVSTFDCDIVSWEEEKIVAKLPVRYASDIVIGESYGVEVITGYETISTELELTIRDNPSVTSMSPTEGHVGQTITFKGSNLPSQSTAVKVMFGNTETEIENYNIANGSGSFTVKVPVGLQKGACPVKIFVGDLKAFEGTFTVLATPSLATPDFKLVRAGETVAIAGAYLGTTTNGVTAKLGDTKVSIVSISDNKLEIKIPSSLSNVHDQHVTLTYDDGRPCVSEVYLDILGATGDVTDMILENSRAPFISKEGVNNGYATPAGNWLYNDAFWVGDQRENLIYPLRYDDGNEHKGCITFICNRWAAAGNHLNWLVNGKMYQDIVLPAGRYEFIGDVMGCGLIAGQMGVAMGVVPQGTELPDIDGASYWDNGVYKNTYAPVDPSAYIANSDGSRAYVMLTDYTVDYGNSLEYRFVLELKERKALTFGFTAWATMAGGNGMNFELRGVTVKAIN